MKTKLILFLFLIGNIYSFGQNYPNIVNYNFNGTPAHGVKIKTNLPFTDGVQMPIIKIEGYNFSSVYAIPWNPATLNLNLVWYVFERQFMSTSVSSSGGSTPNVWLSNENGKVVIFLDQRIYFQRFTVSAFAQGKDEKIEFFQGWTVVDAPLAGTQQKQVPYKNIFAGNVGIGTEAPQEMLEVAGTIKSQGAKLGILELDNPTFSGTIASSSIYYPGHYLNIGSKPGVYRNNILSIRPGGSKSGVLSSSFELYTSPKEGLLNKKVQIHSENISFFNGGDVGIGTEYPTTKLDVRGVISASEIKVQVLTGADHVFNSNYALKPLSEVEAFVKENKHLPEIPSEKQMQKDGLNMNEFQIKLLQKIEELTLYTIQLEKRIKQLEKL